MPLLEIKKWPGHDLRQPSLPIPPSVIGTGEVQDLIEDMKSYVDRNRYQIGGLAANQLGFDYKIAVVNLDLDLQEMINPRYVKLSEQKFWGFEACLSFPRFFSFPVRRSRTITLRAFNRFGKEIELSFNGRRAIRVQHEMDHLNGISIIDIRRRARFLRENQAAII
ncbi:peptide deformylase [Candidatus Daviesbacteria bacterium]|nr:peptide deformylase [Candidatus Daviesbacteria bacterium]